MISDRAMVRALNSTGPRRVAARSFGRLPQSPNQPRACEEPAGRLKRQRLSTQQRLELLEREKSRCHLCNGEIQPGQAWDVSHEIPLELYGPDDDTNRRAAHRKCHRRHTATVDIPAIAKAKRVRAKYHGAAITHRPMRGGRRDALKKRMDGTVVLRATGKPWRFGRIVSR